MVPEQSVSILTALGGQSITLPDLNSIFHDWPKEVNPGLDQLRRAVDEWLDSTMSHSSKLESLKAADLGYFGATWWPRARYDRLKTLTFYIAWLFVWDDEVDGDNCSLWDNFELSDAYRLQTREFIRSCLGLDDHSALDPAKPVNATVKGFETVGMAIRKAYSHDQCQRFMDHMGHYVDMAREEQMLRLQGTLPSLEEFWSYRKGTSAVHAIIALNEFALENHALPNSLMENDDMKLLWDYTNIIISTVNDLCSLKKEIARGSINSMIPILYAQSNDLQLAYDRTAAFLAVTVKKFQNTTQRLLNSTSPFDVATTLELDDFVRGCQFYCSGNLTWTLTSRRYGICEEGVGSETRVTLPAMCKEEAGSETAVTLPVICKEEIGSQDRVTMPATATENTQLALSIPAVAPVA